MKNYKVYYHKISKELSGYDHDKYYIGITCKRYISDRWGKDGKGYKNQIFYRAIQKYGWDNIEHKILFENLNGENANLLEETLIKILKTDNPVYGYNYTRGGDGIKACDKVKIHPIYCKELNILFRTAAIAASYTNDKASTISNHYRDKNICPGKTLKYTYCYIENMYKYYDKLKMNYNSNPVVRISDGNLFGSCNIANKLLNASFDKRYTLTYNEYIKRRDAGGFYKKDYLMYAKDYLLLFDMTKFS